MVPKMMPNNISKMIPKMKAKMIPKMIPQMVPKMSSKYAHKWRAQGHLSLTQKWVAAQATNVCRSWRWNIVWQPFPDFRITEGPVAPARLPSLNLKSSVQPTRQLPEASDRNATSRCIALIPYILYISLRFNWGFQVKRSQRVHEMPGTCCMAMA